MTIFNEANAVALIRVMFLSGMGACASYVATGAAFMMFKRPYEFDYEEDSVAYKALHCALAVISCSYAAVFVACAGALLVGWGMILPAYLIVYS